MYTIDDLLLALDLSEMDEVMAEYAAMVSQKTTVERIFFVHIAKELDLPEEIVKAYPNLVKPLGKSIEEHIQKLIDNYFPKDSSVKFEIVVKEGKAANEILKLAKDNDIELIVLGRKTGLAGDGHLANKIAKLATCSVAFIPEVLPRRLEKILIPIDFSDTSKLALEFAAKVASLNEGAKIICQHVYQVPLGYHSSGKTYKEFSDIMCKNAEKRFEVFKKDIKVNQIELTCKMELSDDEKPSEKIYKFAIREKVDAIVLGSKGRTAVASLLLGSTAEGVLNFNKQIPLFVIKEKYENMSFLDALLKL